MLAGGAGIFNSRIGSFLGSELWRAGWLLGGLFIVVVGPGGRISTVDCSRVLNVNWSLYSSTSRGRAQRDVLRAQRARPVATRPRLVLLERLLFTFNCLYSSFTTGRLHGGLLSILCDAFVCLSVQWEI